MSREDPQFKLRMPQALRDHLEESAKENKRSMNAEIVARLEESCASGEHPQRLYVQALLADVIEAASNRLSAAVEQKLDGVELVQVKSADGKVYFRKRPGSGE